MATSSAVNRRKLKKMLSGVLAVALVALLSILLTVAYLRDKTDEKTHTFTLGANVDIILNQDTRTNITAEPGKEYPSLQTTVTIPQSAMATEYIAVKVFFYKEEEKTSESQQKYLQYTPISYADFKSDYGDLYSYNKSGLETSSPGDTKQTSYRSDWLLDATTESVSSGAVFYYKGTATDGKITPVAHGSTVVVFDSVQLSQSFSQKYTGLSSFPTTLPLEDETGSNITGGRTIQNKDQLKGFKIVVCAYAVQGNIDAGAAKTALKNLADSNPATNP